MLLNKKVTLNESDYNVGYIECMYDSSNILTSIYFPEKQNLYVSFHRGGVYKYENVDFETYDIFENAESQGKFLNSVLKNNEKYTCNKMYNLFPSEIDGIRKLINESKENEHRTD